MNARCDPLSTLLTLDEFNELKDKAVAAGLAEQIQDRLGDSDDHAWKLFRRDRLESAILNDPKLVLETLPTSDTPREPKRRYQLELLRSRIYLACGEPWMAREAEARAFQLASAYCAGKWAPLAILHHARALARAGDVSEARHWLDKKFPRKSRQYLKNSYRLTNAIVFFFAGEFKSADSELEKTKPQHPFDDAAAALLRARILVALGRSADGQCELDGVLEFAESAWPALRAEALDAGIDCAVLVGNREHALGYLEDCRACCDEIGRERPHRPLIDVKCIDTLKNEFSRTTGQQVLLEFACALHRHAQDAKAEQRARAMVKQSGAHWYRVLFECARSFYPSRRT